MTLKELEEGKGLVQDADPRKRFAGLHLLTKSGKALPLDKRADVVSTLEPLASDREAFLRWNLAMALGELGHPAALPLLERLAKDAHANVRIRVALAIGLIGHPKGLPILEVLATDGYEIGGHFVVREATAFALGKLGLPEGVSLLKQLASDEDPEVRWHVAVALGDIGDPQGGSTLTQLLVDQVPFVRGHAAIGLAQIGAKDAFALLKGAAEREAHPKMKTVIADAARLLQEVAAR